MNTVGADINGSISIQSEPRCEVLATYQVIEPHYDPVPEPNEPDIVTEPSHQIEPHYETGPNTADITTEPFNGLEIEKIELEKMKIQLQLSKLEQPKLQIEANRELERNSYEVKMLELKNASKNFSF